MLVEALAHSELRNAAVGIPLHRATRSQATARTNTVVSVNRSELRYREAPHWPMTFTVRLARYLARQRMWQVRSPGGQLHPPLFGFGFAVAGGAAGAGLLPPDGGLAVALGGGR